MMRIIRGSITILKSEQGHSPALCREMIAQKADNTLRPAGSKALEDKADLGFCHADSSRILAPSHIHLAISVPPSEPATPWTTPAHLGYAGVLRAGIKLMPTGSFSITPTHRLSPPGVFLSHP